MKLFRKQQKLKPKNGIKEEKLEKLSLNLLQMYCKKNNRVQTSEVNVILDLIYTLSGSLNGVKKEELVKNNQFSALVTSIKKSSNLLQSDINNFLNY
jgi:hypothetical protein